MDGNNPAISDVPVPSSSANLRASPSDAEAQLIDKERWKQLSQMAATGQSISAIARALDLDRKTVRCWLREQQWAPYRRQPVVTTLLAQQMVSQRVVYEI